MNFDFWGAGLFMGAAICFSLVACGGDDSNSASNPTKETVASTDNLGICSEDVCNQKVFVEEDSAYFVCDGEKWIEEMDDDDEDSVSVTDPESSVKSSSSSVDVPPSSAPESSAESSSSSVDVPSSSAPESSSSEKVAWAYLNPKISYGLMQDLRDGQYYKTVQIGDQVWMAENLNYDPGDVSSMGTWAMNACYGNLPENCAKYGRLYTWEVAMNSKSCGYGLSCKPSGTVRGICPEGWHLPSLDEFITLIEPMASDIDKYDDDNGTGKYFDAGKMLKSQTGWKPSSFGDYYSQSSNESGFTALPGGGIDGARKFSLIEEYAYFWSASEYEGVYGYEQNVAYSLQLEHARYTAYLGMETKTNVASVRCIQNTR